MGEIEFFADDNEILDIMRIVIEEKFVIIPDLQYTSKSIRHLTSVSEIRAVSDSTSLYYIIKEELLESPLHLREVTTPDKHFYYISPRVGGPSMQFYWGGEAKKSDRRQLAASWLSYYPWYEDSITGERKKPPKGLAGIYIYLSKRIRTNRRKIKPGVRAFWISPHIEQLVREETSLVGLEKFSVDRILNNQGKH